MAVSAGGMAEYEGVRNFLAELNSLEWACSETVLINRDNAPRLLLSYRLPSRGAAQQWRPNVTHLTAEKSQC